MNVGSLFLSLFATGLCLAAAVPGERRLHGDLLAGYNKQIRPVLNESDTVHAAIGLSLIEFSLDEKTDVLESLVWMRLKWKDQYLRWQPSEYENITTTMFSAEDIWTPDICLYNSWERTCQLPGKLNTNIIAWSDGSVLFVPPARLTSRCTMDRTNWPRDTAVCELKFGSWTHHGFLINLTQYSDTAEPDMTDLRPNMHWEVTRGDGGLQTKYYSCCDEPYHSYAVQFWLRRQEHRAAELSMPIICAAVLSLLSFVVPLQSPQKLTFCWVSLLIAVLGLLNAFIHMPVDAHGTASIATFYVTFTTLLLIVTGVQAVLLRVARPRAAPLPRCVRGCLAGGLGRLLCLDTPVLRDYANEDNEMLDSSQDGDIQKMHLASSRKTEEWAVFASALNHICGVVFLVLLAIVVPPNITWK